MDLKDEMEKLRAQLLDMGKNNNLVNYQYNEDRSIRIVDIKTDDIFRKLVIDGEGPRIISSKSVNQNPDDLKGSASQTDIDHRLSRLIRRYHEDYESLGYSTVYVALGFLSWRTNTNNKAPMVLIPAELKRDDSGNVRIFWNGDDVRLSPTFVEKLKDLNIRIPEQESIDDIDALSKTFDTVRNAIEGRTGFKIINTIAIDLFDFSKSVMYKDLDPANWNDIPELVRRIFDPSVSEEPAAEREIPSCTYSILDGDSSQMSVVMDVLDGRSVVVEGPPGTGKSQTISNIISECLGNGKTVLFVSEKMAALNVVKRRLDDANLSSYVLELHSDNMNRKNFLKEMERSMNRDTVCDTSQEQECIRLERIRNDLDAYAKAISEPIGKRNFTPYQMIGMRDIALGNIKRRRRVPTRIEIEDPLNIDTRSWDACMDLIRTAAEVIPLVTPVKKNPWKDCDIRNLTPDKEYALKDHIYNINKRLDDIQTLSKDVCKIIGVSVPHTLGDMTTLDRECRNILKLGSISLKDAMEGDAETYAKAADAVIVSLTEIQRLRADLMKRYRSGLLEFDTTEKHDELIRSKKGLLKKTYKDVKKKFESNSFSTSLSDDSFEKDFEELHKYQTMLAAFDHEDKDNLFGDKWKGVESRPELLKNVRDWTVSVKENIANKRFTDTTALIIARGGSGTSLDSRYKELGECINGLFRSLDSVTDILGMDPEDRFENGYDDVKPAAVRKWLKELNGNMDSLRPWGNYCDMMERFMETPIGDMAKKIASGDIHPLDIMDTFIIGYTGALLAEAIESRPPLRDFSIELHELWSKDFNTLDSSLLETNSIRLRKELLNITEKRMEEQSDGIRILKGEFNRGNGQMSVRKMMNLAGPAIQAIKPCFMMSPRSVAQYLWNKNIKFDVVIFDEASQVLPADSLGTLLRGRQAVVMGDSKQLPPTIFFERKEEGSTEAATARDMESLLNLCRASLPVRVLSWHYRSRHSSLMALSNRLFYDDRLMVCPSPAPAPEGMGLKLRYVRTAVYDRGSTGTNQKEAKMIARAVWHHYVDTPEKSLGVATFNINQQKAITEEVEKMFKRHPEARANMMLNKTEPLIIRNLESIQGDERDVMFVSIGYGYDSDGKLSKNFGSLNRAGGERRLNVLMTRARDACVMFSNFKAMDMGIRENMPEGVSALQAYLEYAETGWTSKLDSPPVRDDLVDSVAAFLTSKGVKVDMNVGSSEFRIDVAVCSPTDTSSYILGICLDGNIYQNMKYTRDRERTFNSLLQRMGWNTYRLRSMEWYANPEGSKKKLWSKVSGALAKISGRPAADPEMFELVSEIVEKESPVHKDRLNDRVRTHKKLPSLSIKVRADIANAVSSGISLGRFEEHGDFLIIPGRPIFPVMRNAKEKWKPEWVHPEEYVRALKDSISIELSEEQIILLALSKLGLPPHKVFREEIQRYLGVD